MTLVGENSMCSVPPSYVYKCLTFYKKKQALNTTRMTARTDPLPIEPPPVRPTIVRAALTINMINALPFCYGCKYVARSTALRIVWSMQDNLPIHFQRMSLE